MNLPMKTTVTSLESKQASVPLLSVSSVEPSLGSASNTAGFQSKPLLPNPVSKPAGTSLSVNIVLPSNEQTETSAPLLHIAIGQAVKTSVSSITTAGHQALLPIPVSQRDGANQSTNISTPSTETRSTIAPLLPMAGGNLVSNASPVGSSVTTSSQPLLPTPKTLKDRSPMENVEMSIPSKPLLPMPKSTISQSHSPATISVTSQSQFGTKPHLPSSNPGSAQQHLSGVMLGNSQQAPSVRPEASHQPCLGVRPNTSQQNSGNTQQLSTIANGYPQQRVSGPATGPPKQFSEVRPGDPRQIGTRPGNPQQTGSRSANPQQYQVRPGDPRQLGTRPGNPQQTGSRSANPQQYQVRPGNTQQTGSRPGNPQQTETRPGSLQQSGVRLGNPQRFPGQRGVRPVALQQQQGVVDPSATGGPAADTKQQRNGTGLLVTPTQTSERVGQVRYISCLFANAKVFLVEDAFDKYLITLYLSL